MDDKYTCMVRALHFCSLSNVSIWPPRLPAAMRSSSPAGVILGSKILSALRCPSEVFRALLLARRPTFFYRGVSFVRLKVYLRFQQILQSGLPGLGLSHEIREPFRVRQNAVPRGKVLVESLCALGLADFTAGLGSPNSGHRMTLRPRADAFLVRTPAICFSVKLCTEPRRCLRILIPVKTVQPGIGPVLGCV